MLPFKVTPSGRRLAGMRGFALSEAVVAIAILGMIGTLTYGAFFRIVAAQETAHEISDRYSQIRLALNRMSRELSMAFLSQHRFCQDPRSDTLFVSKRTGGGMRLDFTSFAHRKLIADANESDQVELSYYIDDDPDFSKSTALFRRAQPRIDEEPDEGGNAQVLAHQVTKLEFEFYDDRNDRWDSDWDSKNLDHRDRLPMFVAAELTALTPDPKGRDGMSEEKFVTKTKIIMRQALLIPGANFSRCLD